MTRWCLVFLLVACGSERAPEPTTEERPETETAEPEVEGETPEAETPEPEVDPSAEWIDLLQLRDSWVSAGSAYRNDPAQVGRLVDGELETAWNSASDRDTDRLLVRVPEGSTIRAVELTVGYTKMNGDTDLFTGNRRIRSVSLRELNGNEIQAADLDIESRELQRITLDEPLSDRELHVVVTSFEPGSNERWTELAVSELRVLGEHSSPPQAGDPHVFLGTLPVLESFRFGAMLLDETWANAGIEEEPPEISEGRRYSGVFGRPPRNASVDVRLAGNKCYFVFGQVFTAGEDSILPQVRLTLDDTEVINDLDGEAGPTFSLGVNEEICPESTGRYPVVIDHEGAASYWFQVFERRNPGDDDLDDTANDDDLGDELDTDGAGGFDPTADPFMLTREEGIHLTELTLGPSVESRQVVDARRTFSKADDERVYCLTRLENPERMGTSLYMGWERDDRPADPDDPSSWGRELSIPDRPRYVTFGYRGTGQRPAKYWCVIRDEDGTILGRASYDLTE